MKNKANNKKQARFAQIAKLGQTMFHTRDLGNLWNTPSDNTLYTLLKRYTQQGLLFRIYKGLYSIVPIEKLDPVQLGLKALHTYAYVSCEYVLAQHGIIQQHTPAITLVSNISRTFSLNGHHYKSRKLSDKHLYNTFGITKKNGIQTATLDRAVADMLYYNKNAYFDAQSKINWDNVVTIQKQIGYPVVNRGK
jgi:predicted transcriptional regulator of viral defense system